MMSNAQIISHQLPSSIESLSLLENIIEEIKSLHHVPEELYGNILVSVTEAVNNAIRHGNKFKEALLVDLQFELNDEAYSFQIKDQGEGFDYTNIPDPTHPDNLEKPDGRGIFIMESLSDEVKFQDKGSVVNIKFLRK